MTEHVRVIEFAPDIAIRLIVYWAEKCLSEHPERRTARVDDDLEWMHTLASTKDGGLALRHRGGGGVMAERLLCAVTDSGVEVGVGKPESEEAIGPSSAPMVEIWCSLCVDPMAICEEYRRSRR